MLTDFQGMVLIFHFVDKPSIFVPLESLYIIKVVCSSWNKLWLKHLGPGVDCDGIISFWWSRACSCMGFTIQLALHKEVAFLFQVQVAVRTDKAVRVAELVPSFYHGASIFENMKNILFSVNLTDRTSFIIIIYQTLFYCFTCT